MGTRKGLERSAGTNAVVFHFKTEQSADLSVDRPKFFEVRVACMQNYFHLKLQGGELGHLAP